MKKCIKIFSLTILIVLTAILFVGCGGVYDDVRLSCNTTSLTLKLYANEDGDGLVEKEDSVAEVSLSVSGVPDGLNKGVVYQDSNPGRIKLEMKTNQDGTIVATITAIYPGKTTIKFYTISGHVEAKVDIDVQVPLTDMFANSSYAPYVTVGDSLSLSPLQVVTFLPGETTEKDMTFSLKENVEGVELDNDVLKVTKKTANYVTVLATSTVINKTVEFNVRIIEPIALDGVKYFLNSYDGYDEDAISSLIISNNVYEENTKTIVVKVDTIEEITLSAKSSSETVFKITEVKDIGRTADGKSQLFKITLTGINTGEKQLKLTIKLQDFDYETERNLDINVYNYATNIKVNNDSQQDKEINIYSSYYDGRIGENLKVELSPLDSYEKKFFIVMPDGYQTNLKLTLIDGVTQVKVVPSLEYFKALSEEEQTEYLYESGVTICVSGTNQFITGTYPAVIYTYATYGLVNPSFLNLNFTCRRSIAGFTASFDTIYIQRGTQIALGIDENGYSEYFYMIASDTNVVAVEYFQYAKDMMDGNRISLRIGGKNDGESDVTVITANGVSITFHVVVFVQVTDFSLYTDSLENNSSIGDLTYEEDSFGVNTLTKVSIEIGKTIPIYNSKYLDINGIITNIFGINKVKIEYSTDGTGIAVNKTTGAITAYNVGTYTVICDFYIYTAGIVDSKTQEPIMAKLESKTIEVEVFIPITNIKLNEKQLTLYDVNKLNIYEKTRAEANLNVSVFPQGSVSDYEVYWSWSSSCFANNSNSFVLDSNLEFDQRKRIQITEDGKYVLPDGVTIPTESGVNRPFIACAEKDGYVVKNGYLNITAQISEETSVKGYITVTVIQKGRVYVQRCDVTVIKPVDVTSVYCPIESIYIDARDGLGETSKYEAININHTYVNPRNATFQDLLYVFIKEEQDGNSLEMLSIDEIGNITPQRTGNGKIFIISKSSCQVTIDKNTVLTGKTSEGESYDYYSNYLTNNGVIFTSVEVRIVDGQTEATAIEIESVDDLLKIGSSLNSMSLYYVLTSNINMASVDNWKGIGYLNSGTLVGFRGQLSGKYNYFGKNVQYSIFGLNIKESKNNETENKYYGLFARTTETARLKNINLTIQKIDVNINYKTGTNCQFYFGGLVALNQGAISDCSVTINSSVIKVLSYDVNIGAVVGYMVGGELTNTTSSGELVAYRNYTADSAGSFIVGGLIGRSEIALQGDFNFYIENPEDSIIYNDSGYSSNMKITAKQINENGKPDNSRLTSITFATGGVVGLTSQPVRNFATQVTIDALDNVGGIVGYAKNYVENCFSSSHLFGVSNVGGIAGKIENAVFKNNVFLVFDDYEDSYRGAIPFAVSGYQNVGGLVGLSSRTNIQYSYFKSFIFKTFENYNLINYNITTGNETIEGEDIKNACHYFGDVAILGVIRGNTTNDNHNLGGVVGRANSSNISYSYFNGYMVSNRENIVSQDDFVYVGGLVGSYVSETNELKEISVSFARFNFFAYDNSINETENNNVGAYFGKLTINEDCEKPTLSDLYAVHNKNLNAISSMVANSVTWGNRAEGFANVSYPSQLNSFATETSYWSIDSKYNNGFAIFKYGNDFMTIEAPTSISALINSQSNEYMEYIMGLAHYKVNDSTAVMYYFKNSAYNTYYIKKLLTVSTTPSSAVPTFVNIYSSDDTILQVTGNKLVINGTGTVTISIVSRLNRDVRTSITVYIIDAFTTFGVYKTADYKHEYSPKLLINSVNRFYIKSDNSAINIELRVEHSGNADTVKKALNIDNHLWTIDGGYLVTSISATEAFIIKNEVFGTYNIQCRPYITIEGEKVYLKTALGYYNLSLDYTYGITGISVDKTDVELSLKDNVYVNIYVEVDPQAVLDEPTVLITDLLGNELDSSYLSDITPVFTENKTINGKNYKVYSVFISANVDSHTNLLEEIDYKISFNFQMADSNTTVEGASASVSMDIRIVPQDLFSISTSFFANNELERKENGDIVLNVNEVPGDTILAGKWGLMKINLYPYYASYDNVEIEYSTTNGYGMSMQQVVFDRDNMNYRVLYPISNPTTSGNGLILQKQSSVHFDSETGANVYEFDGYIYVLMIVSSNTEYKTNYKISVSAYKQNDVFLRKTVDITSDVPTGIDLKTKGKTHDQVAYECSTTATVVVTKLEVKPDASNITWKCIESDKTETVLEPYSIGTGERCFKYSNGSGYFVVVIENVLFVNDYMTQITYRIENYMSVSKTFEIVATMKKVSGNSSVEIRSESIIFRSTLFVVDDFGVADVINNNTYQRALSSVNSLKVTLNATYADSQKSIAEEEIKQLEEQINTVQLTGTNTLINPYFYFNELVYDDAGDKVQTLNPNSTMFKANVSNYVSGEYNKYESLTNLGWGNKPHRERYYNFSLMYQETGINTKKFYLNFKPNRVSTGDKIIVAFKIDYYETENNNIIVVPAVNEVDGLNYKEYDAIGNGYTIFKKELLTDLYARTDSKNAVPVESAGELEAMKQNIYYRLTKDIVISEPWKPLDVNIKGLDGNGYSIILEKGFEITQESSENIGLFANVYEQTEIKNLVIKVNRSYIDESSSEVSVVQDMSVNTNQTISIGVLAGNNQGKIFNCSVENASCYTYITDPDSSATQIVYGNSTSPYTIKFSSIQIRDNVNASIGGLVGTNNGYITNSHSSLSISANYGKLGGLVGTNSKKISSSYFKASLLRQGNETGDYSYRNIILNNVAIEHTNTDNLGAVGGLVANNSTAGEIFSCSVEGVDMISEKTFASLISDSDKEIYKLKDYSIDNNDSFRYVHGEINASIDIGGFVYQNDGLISNCYSNMPISSNRRSSGFVYNNTGRIISSYSASKTKLNNTAHTVFTGTDSAGNLLNSGTIKDCLYLPGKIYVPINGRKVIIEPANAMQIENKTYGATTQKSVLLDGFNSFVFGNTKSSDSSSDGIWNIPSTTYTKDEQAFIKLPVLSMIEITNQLNSTTRTLFDGKEVDESTGIITYFWSEQNLGLIEEKFGAFNPYTVADVEDYLEIFDPKNASGISLGTTIASKHIVFIADINFNSFNEVVSSNKKLEGTFVYGNNMTLKNVEVVADSSVSKSFGIFSSIEAYGDSPSVVKDLNIQTNRVYANNVAYVGVLAGIISNSNVYNIAIDGENAVVQGKNFVGGLAGIIYGDSNIYDIDVNISVNATFSKSLKYAKTLNSFWSITSDEKNIEYSYSGALAGIIQNHIFGARKSVCVVNGVNITGNSRVIGYTVGTVTGYLAKNCVLDNVSVMIRDGQYIKGIFIEGGIVGENHGTIQRTSIQHEEQTQAIIDASAKYSIVNNRNVSFFVGTPYVIGGLVGVNISADNIFDSELNIITNPYIQNNKYGAYYGVILNSYSKVDVRNRDAKIAGGLVGTTLGGELVNCYATGSVTAKYVVGGIMGTASYVSIVAPAPTVTDNNLSTGEYLFDAKSFLVLVPEYYVDFGNDPSDDISKFNEFEYDNKRKNQDNNEDNKQHKMRVKLTACYALNRWIKVDNLIDYESNYTDNNYSLITGLILGSIQIPYTGSPTDEQKVDPSKFGLITTNVYYANLAVIQENLYGSNYYLTDETGLNGVGRYSDILIGTEQSGWAENDYSLMLVGKNKYYYTNRGSVVGYDISQDKLYSVSDSYSIIYKLSNGTENPWDIYFDTNISRTKLYPTIKNNINDLTYKKF